MGVGKVKREAASSYITQNGEGEIGREVGQRRKGEGKDVGDEMTGKEGGQREGEEKREREREGGGEQMNVV